MPVYSARPLRALCPPRLPGPVQLAADPSAVPLAPNPPPPCARSKASKEARAGYRAILFGATGTFNTSDPHGFRVGELAAGAEFPSKGLTGNLFDVLPGE
jgi:hypothetical protein